MTDDIEEFERKAREAQLMADKSQNDADRATWLRLAQQWLTMLAEARRAEHPQIDQSEWPAERDSDSKSSH